MARSFDWHCRVHRKRRGEMGRGYKKEGEGGLSPERTAGPEKLVIWKSSNSEVPKKSGKSARYKKRGGSEVA